MEKKVNAAISILSSLITIFLAFLPDGFPYNLRILIILGLVGLVTGYIFRTINVKSLLMKPLKSNLKQNVKLPSKQLYVFSSFILVACIVCGVLFFRQRTIIKYNEGISQYEQGNYYQAIDILTDLGNYKDSLSYIKEANNWLLYEEALTLYNAGKYDDALDKFSLINNIDGFNYTKELQNHIAQIRSLFEKLEINDSQYRKATSLYKEGEYEKAFQIFEQLDNYKDSSQRLQECERALLLKQRLQNATTISAGARFAAGVTEEGKVVFAGHDYTGEEVVRGWDDIISVSVNGDMVLGLRGDGSVVVANSASGYHANTEGWEDIIAISAGQQYIVGLKEDGTLIAQGHNGYGEIDVDDWHDIVAISTGWQHTVGLDKDGDIFDDEGNVYLAGYNSPKISEEIRSNREDWSNLIAITTGGSSPGFSGAGHVVGLKADHTVIAAGDNSFGQCNVTDWTNIIAIAAGDFHTVGLKMDGSIVTTLEWHNDSINEVLQNSPSTKFVEISAGYGTTLALTNTGAVVGAGYADQGQLETLSWSDIAYYG